MKKFMSFFLTIAICFSLTLPAYAMTSDGEKQWTDTPVELTVDDIAQENSTRAGIDIEVYRSAYNIPDSTPMLSKGIVSDGIITYEIKVGILVTNNGTGYANQSVTWNTTASSSNARFISGDSRTNSKGQAFAYFHVRNLSNLPVRVVCAGVTTNESISVPTDALYNSSFYITYYIVADENDYSGSKTESISGISGLFKPAFLAAVRLNGSGRDTNNRFIKYYNGKYSLESPTTASGTTPTVNKTIAVDSYYIPMVNRSGWKRGVVDITSTGLRRAEDTGGAIDEFHIDVYAGVGMSSITENNHNSRVLFKGVNTWDSLSNKSLNSDENYLEQAEGVQNIWYSEEGNLCALVSNRDYSNPDGRIQITVLDAEEKNNVLAQLSLSQFALDVVDVTFIDETHIGIESHINPSTNVYEIFDLNTETVDEVYYGYGFTHYDDIIYYVQAPQHFSGISGYNRIITSTGNLVYESPADVTINDDLSVRNASIYFTESDSQSGEKEMQSIGLSNFIPQSVNGNIYYY